MVKTFMLSLLSALVFSIYPSLDHPPIFIFQDGFVVIDVQTSHPATLSVFVRVNNDEFVLLDSPSERHRLQVPVKEDFTYLLSVDGYKESGFVRFPSKSLKRAVILIYGDTRNDGTVQEKIVKMGKEMGADFLIHLGDIAYTDLDDGDWGKFFRVVSQFGKVIFTVEGNHEYPGFRYHEYLYPSNYSFNIGAFHFIVLDGGTFPGIMEYNLRKLLVKGRRNILLVHEPFYTCSNHSADIFVRLQEKFAKSLGKYGIRYVISSHDHNYQRIERGGIVQLIIGGGGAPRYRVRKECSGLKTFSENYSFALMRINGETAKIDVYNLSGDRIDSLVIGK